jgi:phage terminase small subunit
MMPSLKNVRHERFAQEVAQGKSAGEAYRLAGYRAANHSAETAGPRLLKNVQIQQRIVQLQQKVARKAEISLESLLQEAETQRLAALGAKQYAAANGALKLKAELSGHIIQRREDVTPRRSESEIDARLRELLAAGDQAGGLGASGAAPSHRRQTQLN